MTGWRMRPTASALGVVAIVSAMIAATTASETFSDATEHPLLEEERRAGEEPRTPSNITFISIVPPENLSNSTSNEITVSILSLRDPANPEEPVNDSIDAESIAAAQFDENSASNPIPPSEVWQDGHEDPAGRTLDHNSSRYKVLDASRDYPGEPTRAESASSVGPWEEDQFQVPWRSELDDVPVDDEGLSNVVAQGDEEGMVESVLEPHNREYLDGMVTWISGIATEARPIEQRNMEDIRAISFPVPPPADQFDKQGDQELRKEARKDHPRRVNNHLHAGSGKSTKGFYEIKPSVRTDAENDHLYAAASTVRTLPGRKFVLPTVDSAFGKFGPYFEDGDRDTNITARIGSTMLLDCRIGMLGDKEVAWLQQHTEDSFRLLTVGKTTYSVDQRISLNFRYPSNWRLQIQYASPRDSGLYKCQITTHPPMVKKINVVVTAPELTITDDSGRVVPKERHLKAGSALKLRCEARDVLESLKETVIWTRGDETLTDDVSENRTTEVSVGKEVLVIVSTLIVERASPRHAGNYSCVVPGKANTTIAVHVLNGELPAAVHDGNGVSRAFLNLWLIHLTMSYVFSR
nr:uncharacterized protein LOC116429918 [Nomia melanderi]XP_031839309.1 uncharacterized protein LOC116429918 [Nomia melanderi]